MSRDYLAECFAEAAVREARYTDAASMSRTRIVGDSLKGASEDDIARRIVDNRICFRCGARWGKCEHTEASEC